MRARQAGLWCAMLVFLLAPQAFAEEGAPRTWCNPLPLPDYPRGKFTFDKNAFSGFVGGVKRDFRETGDPTVIFYKDAWYLFPSCAMAWRSEDGVNWTYHPIEPSDIGYAPTVAQKGDTFYLTAQSDRVWSAPHPLGPWKVLGPIKDETGKPTRWWDPMLFVDDDGTMYCYYFKGEAKTGIFAVKLKDGDPTAFDGPPVHCFAFDPAHVWERYGDQNQDAELSWIEGPWMTKANGRYYLQYSGCGAQWKTYAVGCYMGEKPLGPFTYQPRNPILRHTGGLVNGVGHHSIVKGPGGSLWCFYTVLVRIDHDFERRLGMDPAGFDADGNLFVAGPTETPQWAPDVRANPERGNGTGWVNLSAGQGARASSSAPGREAAYAVDDNIRTWWEAAGDGPQWLEADLGREYAVESVRTMFADRGLEYAAKVVPGPYRYEVLGSKDGQAWVSLVDRRENAVERHIAYDRVDGPPKRAQHVRLVVHSAPRGMRIGVWEFTLFGTVPPPR
jgi:xylan 1,4-beta-xylosidase